MDKKQLRIILICLGLVAMSFVIHQTVVYIARLQQKHQQAIRDAHKQKPSPFKDDLMSAFITKPADSPFKVTGIWAGNAVLDPRGICDLRLEIKSQADALSAYSTFSCIEVRHPREFMYANPMSLQGQVRQAMRQDSAILTGKPEGENIRFSLQQAIGANINGCAVTAITVTPFGQNRIAVEWTDGKCPDGTILLQRGRS